MTVAIILNLQQAEAITKSKVIADEVLAFCPSAKYHLEERGYKVTSTLEPYRSLSHARTVLLVDKNLGEITKLAAKQYRFEEGEAAALRVYLYHYLCSVYYMYFSVRAYKNTHQEFIWVEANKVRKGDYAAMFSAIAAQPSPKILNYANTHFSYIHHLIMAMSNRVLAYFIARSNRIKVINFGDELPKRIVGAIIQNNVNPIVINTRKPSINMGKSFLFFVKSLARLCGPANFSKPVMVFRTTNPRLYKKKAEAFRITHLYSYEVTLATKRAVENFIPFMRAEFVLGKKLVLDMRPDIAVSDHAKYASILGGLEALRSYGGLHAMLNHGTHTIQHDSMSLLAAKLWGNQERIINKNTTHSLPKSPLTEQLARLLRDDNRYKTCKINVYGTIPNLAANAPGKFVILQAGNYTDAFSTIPWCKETADEYLQAILELIEEVTRLENVQLIIKLKNKKADIHKTVVQAYIDAHKLHEKVVVDTTTKFSEAMSKANLIVSNLSGTIEEALANNIPVMIHTYRKKYFHIPEAIVKKSANGVLAPAYLVKEKKDIGDIIRALMPLRKNLSDKALFQHVAWQENELQTLPDFAKDLVTDVRGKP